MDLHNEHNVAPGVYKHHKGDYFVVLDLVTHVENHETGDMDELPREKMLVVYRDLGPLPPKFVNGKSVTHYHQRYALTVEDFFKTLPDGTPRFRRE